MTIADAAPRLAKGQLKSEKLTEECLSQIEALNPKLNAFITVTADEALKAARDADKDIAGGRYRGPLHGIPVSLKDLVDLKGIRTTAGSLVRASHVATEDADVTSRLRDAGAVFVGKTNLHEFAFGGLGSPLQVGALGTVGTDTGGSIRIPAAVCGIVGLKPGWGEISASGVVPLSRQLDHVGPLGACVTDAWIQYNAMLPAGRQTTGVPAAASLKGLRLGVPAGYLFDQLDADVERVVMSTIDTLRRSGAIVTEVAIPHATDMAAIYLHLVLGDAAEYHARTLMSRPQDYTPNVRLRLEMARYVLAEDYVRALRGKAVIAHEVDRAMDGVDALVLPSLAIPAPPIGAVTMPVKGGPEAVRTLMLRCTQPFNLSGHPAISIPCGHAHGGLPIGFQLAGHHGQTPALVQAALAVERAIAHA